ncbi:hypothetical protein DYQ86_02340 [Acidobacteria bacterium AB60]|nr:hypothetical protein DYQ86_02340 [Acidobacteria bacterium AB60]
MQVRNVIRVMVAAALSVAGVCSAQSLDDLNLQIHGYATQGFLYTTQNNILTGHSSDGEPAWSDVVGNVTAVPDPKLRIGVQLRYFMLGNLGKDITLDWASADYKVSDKFGARFGKVKTPSGLFNDIQDIDPSYMWSLLPQSIYPISSRNSVLAHYGGVVYGSVPVGERFGRVEYRGWGGERNLSADDGYFTNFREQGINLKDGLSGPTSGTSLHWRTPLPGFMAGATLSHSNEWQGALVDTYIVPAGPAQGVTITTSGTMVLNPINVLSYYARFERKRLMVAGEYERLAGSYMLRGLAPAPGRFDQRPWYAMTSYKVSQKASAGMYVTQEVDHQALLGPARFFKDWAFSGRYDFNAFLYAKAEQHFIDGTSVGYDIDANPHGLKPDTRLTLLKLGVSF